MSRKRHKGTTSSRLPLVPAGPIPEWVACAWLMHFTIYAERARRSDLAGQPVVLVAPGELGRQAVVRACSPEALAAGLAVGMPTHSITQRCPGVISLPFDAPHY